ncbi:hypothetical protein E3N88_36418 [Mikania micrantha]|uniref:Uncharacterized protein n=1 Tax=Mikania micrantha TaxID=192012 RepID=A0A5N6M478_9ASTR|nr:hypothetical protein E3N88_36418 [Mikania micrantha]
MSSESSHQGALFQPPSIIGDPNLEGTNVGAAMIINRHGGSTGFSSGEVNDGCGLNIYVTNNIQGLNNSIMIGSRLNMGDPGWAVRVGEGQSLILKTSVLKAKESAEKGGKLSVPGSPVAGSSGTTRILS